MPVRPGKLQIMHARTSGGDVSGIVGRLCILMKRRVQVWCRHERPERLRRKGVEGRHDLLGYIEHRLDASFHEATPVPGVVLTA